MSERMLDLVRAVAEAVVAGDGPRIRRLMRPDALVDSAIGPGRLTVDGFVHLHTVDRPYLNWQMSSFEALGPDTSLVVATVSVRQRAGLTLRRAVYLWRFDDRLVADVSVHPSVDEAREAARAGPGG